jgi:predicted lipoprotein with Yx(FWY)xxD motif
LRAWLSEVDRALRVRSRIGVVLIAIASAAAGVALYLAIDASQHSVSGSDVQRLRRQVDVLRAQVSQAAGLNGRVVTAQALARRARAEVARLQAQIKSLRQAPATAANQGAPSGGVGSHPGRGSAPSGAGSKGPASGAGKSASIATTIVSVAGNPKLGKIIVDSRGRTLYDFHKDSGAKSACYGACANIWPPLTSSGRPQAKGGAEASKLGTTQRTDGTTQVTYDGHPLYTYAGDARSGDTKGNGITSFGGSWHALHPSGEEAAG